MPARKHQEKVTDRRGDCATLPNRKIGVGGDKSGLMQRLDPAGMRLTDLAEQARVTKQTAGALVDQLERAGYVERLPDPIDARARLVTLSDRGAAVCRRANAEAVRIEAEWRIELGDKVFATMRAALLRVTSV